MHPHINKRDKAAVRDKIRDEASYSIPFFVMNGLSAVVASMGLLNDSAAVVIGAMVIAMLLGPITGISLALVDGDMPLLKRALVAEFGGVAVVVGISFLIGRYFRQIPPSEQILSRTAPNILDLGIALAGGAAGAYATVSPKLGNGIIGVAISTALAPPLSVFGILTGRGDWELAVGGLLLFAANFVAIQFASSLVLWQQGYHHIARRPENLQGLLLGHLVSIAILVSLGGMLGLNLKKTLQKQLAESAVRTALEKGLEEYQYVHLADLRFSRKKEPPIVVAVVRSPFVFTPDQVERLARQLPLAGGNQYELQVRSVQTMQTDASGFVSEIPLLPKAPQTSSK